MSFSSPPPGGSMTTYGGKHTELLRLKQQLSQLQEQNGNLQDENEELKRERDKLLVLNKDLESIISNKSEKRVDKRKISNKRTKDTTSSSSIPAQDSIPTSPSPKRPRLDDDIPPGVESDNAQPTKRRPGRPRTRPIPEVVLDSNGSPIKRSRGRPRKNPLPVPLTDANGESSPSVPAIVKRGRGRPRKVSGDDDNKTSSSPIKPGPGRPKKNSIPTTAPSNNLVRRPGPASNDGSRTPTPPSPLHSGPESETEREPHTSSQQSRYFIGNPIGYLGGRYEGTDSAGGLPAGHGDVDQVSKHAYVGAVPPYS